MPSQRSQPDTTVVVRIVQKRQKCRPLGNSLLPPAQICISAPAGERDTSQGGSSVASTIHGQNATLSSSLNNSGVADITQCVTSTPSATQQWSINTPTPTPGKSSHTTPAPKGTSQAHWTPRVVSSLASGIASIHTPLSGLENLPTPIPNPEACSIITNSLRTRATERNQWQRQWQLQPQAVCTPWSIVCSSHDIHRFGNSDMTRHVFATGRLQEVEMWNRRPFMSASELETVRYATWRVSKAVAEAPHWQRIEKHWNTAMQLDSIRSIAFEAGTKEILKEVCCSNGPRWILHAQTGTRFEHKSTK